MATQEQIENYREWQRRETLASARVESGQYGYTDPQPENDGVSLASTHDEISQLQADYKLTLAEIEGEDKRARNIQQEVKHMETDPKPNLGQIITRQKFDKWLSINRPHLLSYEITNGQKGVYRKDSSPNKTFIPYGKSWRAVLRALNQD